MSVEDVRRRYNEIDASLLAHGYQPWKEIRDEYNDVSTGMAPASTFGGEDSTGGAGGSFEKTAWDNVKDVASGVFNSLSETISNRMALKNVSEMEPDELSSFGAYMEKPVTWDDVTDIASLRNPFTGEKVPYGLDVITGLPRRAEQSVDFLKESMPDSFKASKLYADYFYTADEKREQRQKVEDYLGIDSAVITNNPELWEKAMKTIQRIEKLKKTPGMLNEDGNLDMEKVYRAMPYLKEIQEKRGTNAAAMVLSEAAGMKTISDVYSNEFTRFYGSVKTGIERGFYTAQRQWTNFKAWKDARRPNAAEEAELRANDKKMEELPNYSYTGPLSAVGAMVGSAFENAPLLLSSGAGQLAGYGAGAAVGAVTKNPAAARATAAWVGNVMSTALMSLEIGANQYETNLSKIDKNGRAMYTPEAAAMLSLAQGVSEGVLEQYTFKQMGRALFGGKEAKAIADLYKKDAALVLAESGMTKEAAAKALIEERLRGAVKSGALMMKAETQEEFLQQASDMIWENAAQIATHGENADISSVEQILQESTAAALEAIPAIAGFGIIGLGGHPMANSRPILSARQHMANLMTSKLYRDAHENLYHANVIEGVANNLENIAELENKAPREVTMALDAQNRQFGMENTVMDVNTLAQMEGGAEVVQAVAEKAGISAEEVAACQQGTGMLEVKTSAVQQAAAKMDEGQKRNLFLNITKDRQSLTPKQLKEETETIKKAMAAFKDASTDEQEKAVEAFVKSNFKDEKIVKAARDILLTDPDHPMGEIRSRKRILRQQLDEILEPIKAGLRGGMKQGVDIVETQEGGTVRVSNNAPWYRKWYADHGRAPSEAELDIIVRDIATGQPTPYSDYPTNDGTPEAQEYFAGVEKQLSALDEEMSTLNKIGKVLGDVRPGDVIATATLSPEARQVYSYLLSGLEQGNKEVQKSARAAALVAARMTDRLVSFHREAGEAGYTAMDALPELLTNAGQETQEKEAAQRFAQAVESQKEAVRKQYEGTAMWMKAPNGKDTNLTEEQWLLVRTPAFKAWFGDWEAEAEKQKYLNTTPIKVMENQIVEKGDISAKEAAFQWAEDNLPVQIVTRFGNVEINRTSIKDSLGHGFSQKKLDAITSLPEGMKVAAFIGEEPDFNGALLDNGYFCYPILYQGETQVVFCRARRDVNSNKVYVHEVWMEDEIKDIPLQTAAKFLNSKPHGGNALYKSILANFLNNSNTASKVVDENGEPLVVYHGTTGGEFSVFDRSYGSIEGDMGNGFYFTDQFDDVTENYEGGGPDFENKVARLAEKIEAEENIDYEEAKERARKEMDKGAALYETFLKIAYPAYVDHTLLFSDEAELYEEINREDYEDEDEYEEAIIQAQEDAWSDIVTNIIDKVNYEGYSVPEDDLRGIYWDAIMGNGISIAELKKQLANLDITDSNGDIANNEVLRITISELGYDGIVDSTVSDKFSNMNLSPETTHYIAFEPTQIKSVDNNGNFSADDPNIYHQANGGRENNFAARQEKGGEKENRDNEISQEVFRTYLNDGIMRSVERTVADEIGQYTNLDAMADPVAKDKARDELPYIKALLVQFNSRTIQKNVDYKDRYAAKIEYARRCFDNDERIKAGATRRMVGNEGQGDLHQNRNGTGSAEYKRGNGAAVQRLHGRVSAGISNQVSGEKRGAREHFEKLYNEMAKKHSENQGAFSHGLYQSITQEIKGDYNQAEAIIRLFEGADTSTFMHEMSHHYLSELKKLSERFPQSEAAKDYATIMEWATWQDGQVEAYAGTASAKEFRERDKAIREAEKNGKEAEVKRLKETWAQERFARAFEEYLHSGDAPTSTLKQIFRRFKRWLTQIYQDVTGAGVRATAKVEAVMARMVATDAEIEAAALLKRANRIAEVAPDLLNTDTAEMVARWEREAKEQAKEKMLKRLLRDLEKKDVEKHLEEYRETVELLMQDTPCWQAERIAKEAGTEDVVLGLGYPSVEAYKADLEKNGGSYDDVLKKEMAAEKKRYEEEMPSRETFMETAQEMLASDEYSLRLTALEEELLNRRKQEYDNPPEKLGKALNGVEEAIEKAIKDDPDALNKAVTVLKYAVNWTDQQAEEIANLQEQVKSLNAKNAEDREAAREKLEEEVRAFKEAILRNTEWLRGIRDAAKGNAKAYQGYAYNRLMSMAAAEATDARHWVREAQREAATAAQNLTNAIRKDNGIKKDDNGGDNQKKAQMAKTRQLTYEAMAKIAFTLRRELSRIENRFAKVQKTLMNDKNGRIDLNHKYFINHLLYVYGLRKQDAIRPSGTNAKTFNALMAELRDLQDPKNEGGGNIGDFDMEIPEWLHAAVLATNPVKDYKHLTIEQLRDLRTFIDFLYTTGKNKNRLISMDMDVDDAVAELAKTYGSRVLPTKPGQGINKYMTELIKPETLLEVLGGKGGTFIKYLYDPLFKAMEQENLMKEKEAGVMNALIAGCYNKKERAAVPTEKIGVTLSNGTELTRENLIAMALNWGNSGNRSRLLAGLQMSESAVKDILEAHMREQDWKFVQAIWDHLEEYGDKVNDVIEKTTGNPMKRVAPEAFKIKVGDEVKEFKGGYYPISYDPERSSRASEFDVLKDAQAVGGGMAFGAGMGSTKGRAAGPMKDAPLKLSLDVLNHHINQQIHIAAMRLACRDVYKLLGHPEIRAMITDTLGVNAWRGLRGWCENVWQQPRQEPLEIIHWTSRLRRNTVAAIMGYRVSTSALNAANIAPMMDELGAANAMSAMMAFARNPQKMTDFVLADSVFMRNRATNMDQDLNVQQEQAFGKHSGLNYNIRKYASWILERTDMLTSVPTYYFRYHEVYNAALAAGKADVIAREEAHKAAHAAVRKVVGSADIVDQAAIQRSKNEMVKLLTPFYSFFNAMMNATWTKYYEGKYTGETTIEEVNGEKRFVPVKQVFIQRYAGFIRSYMFRFVLMSALETGIRRMISEATGGGDDKKKREAWYRRFLKEWMANQMGSALGGFPYINLAADLASQMITGETYQTRGVGVLSTALTRIAKPIQDVNSMMKEKGKVDAITLGRDLTKGVAGTGYGVPDTVTDFGWNTVRFLRDDYRLNNPDNLREYLFKSMFDKPLKAKKK